MFWDILGAIYVGGVLLVYILILLTLITPQDRSNVRMSGSVHYETETVTYINEKYDTE